MLRSKLERAINKRKRGATLLLTLVFVLVTTIASGQSPTNFLKGLLPSPQPSNSQSANLAQSAPVQQEVIPLAQPEDEGEIIVEEMGQGLISLKVRDASLRQVIAMIAETQRINIVFAAAEDIDVSGSLIRVPWRQALETLIASSGHTWTMDQGIIVVTALEAAETIAPRAGGRRVDTFELDFAKAVDVDQTVKGLLSPAGKSWITESSATDNRQSREVIAVVDFPDNLQQIADYICQVDQPPRQVLIKANILQVELEDDCSSGVNLQQLVSLSGKQVTLSTVGLAGIPLSPTPNVATGTSSATILQLTGGSLDGLVELLKETEDAKSLASTELLTVSGQEAKLQSGQRIGYLGRTTTTAASNQQQQEVEFLEVGVLLTVIPQVTRDGRVLMRIKPEVSEGFLINELPNENTVEVDTDVMLNSGQGLVIGGLIREIDSNIQRKVPWLGDIPYAGVLFQKRDLIKSRTEIIVTLIPHVMPFSPIGVAHNDHRMMRTQDPLLSPPLNRFPRPYEAQLPDTFTNPTPVFPKLHYRRAVRAGMVANAAPPTTMPPAMPTMAPTMMVPEPASEQGPLCYPPASTQQPTPVPQQAARGYPTYR